MADTQDVLAGLVEVIFGLKIEVDTDIAGAVNE
jgi:hypothetical protein